MITIPVRVCGDVWCDPEQFSATLRASDPQQHISIDLGAEGPSLAALGILEELRNYCEQTQRDPGSVKLINSPNRIEVTEFENTHRGRSHFFGMCTRYWQPVVQICHLANRLAMFVGRGTVARCSMMFDIAHDPDLCRHFKFSTMNHNGSPIWNPYPGWRVLENFDQWLDPDQFRRMTAWWQHHRPVSLDGKNVRDQYSYDHNTNLSILGHYTQFNVELVAETYTLGETFFPTEKTVRPIMAAKPFLIYAAPGFLHHLRNLGFRTYDHCWDEHYDHYEGPERWRRIKSVLQDLCAMSDQEFLTVMQEAAVTARYNRGVLAAQVLDDKAHLLHTMSV